MIEIRLRVASPFVVIDSSPIEVASSNAAYAVKARDAGRSRSPDGTVTVMIVVTIISKPGELPAFPSPHSATYRTVRPTGPRQR